MRFFLICLGLVIILFFMSSTTLHASDLVYNPNYVKIYYYQTNTVGDDFLEYYTISISEMFHVEHLAFLIFSEVFNQDLDSNTKLYTPKEAKILGISFYPAHSLLTLTLSKETLNYGGTYFEHMFVERLLINTAQLKSVRFLTISIEGKNELVYISSNYLPVPNEK